MFNFTKASGLKKLWFITTIVTFIAGALTYLFGDAQYNKLSHVLMWSGMISAIIISGD